MEGVVTELSQYLVDRVLKYVDLYIDLPSPLDLDAAAPLEHLLQNVSL